jgi:hypothetical protein
VLAKVPVKRLDGKSSFVALTDYIVREASAVCHSSDVFSAYSAGTDMESIACMNERVKDAVYHYVLSWQAGEHPTDSQAFDSVTATLSALNLREHQWICAVHRNTKHVHTHVAVNRINPLTYKSVYPKGDWIALDRVCRQLEVQHQWSQSPGPHVAELGTDNVMHVARTQRDNTETAKVSVSAKARNFAAWNGVESFQEWVGGAPADFLKRTLQKTDANWCDVHRTLKAFNLEYRMKGSGAVVVDYGAPEKLYAKASHIGRFASFAQLSARLGPFEPANELPTHQQSPEPGKASDSVSSYGRVARKDLPCRDKLRAEQFKQSKRYSTAKPERVAAERRRRQRAWSRQCESEQTRIRALREENRAARERIKSTPSRHNKRVLYSVQAFVSAGKRDTLRRRFRDERRQLRAELKSIEIGARFAYSSNQTAARDMGAAATPRHAHFRERTERRSVPLRIEAGTVSGAGKIRKPILEGMNWVADARGVDYRVKNTTMFRDEGQRVVFCTAKDDAIRAGLMLCREKWARGLCINGSDDFKSKVEVIAATMNIRIADSANEHPAPGVEAENIWPPAAVNRNDTSAETKDLRRLFDTFGKPMVTAKLRVGRQHTGRIIDAKIGAGDAGIVAMDVGREVAIIRTDAHSAGRMKAVVGQRMTARAASTETNSKRFAWQFVKPRGIESDLEHSR